MTDLIAVETPLQLLNAVEATGNFRATDIRLVVLLTESFSRARFEALAACLPVRPWKDVRYVRLRTRFPVAPVDTSTIRLVEHISELGNDLSRMGNRLRLWLATRTRTRPHRVYLGNYLNGYKPYFRHLGNSFPDAEVVLLDDGTDTVIVAAERLARRSTSEASNAETPSARRSPLRRLRRWLRQRFIDWNDRPSEAVTFFTAFDISVRPPDRCLRHAYEFIRKHRSVQRRCDELWILGQCLPEDGFVRLEDYVAGVSDLIQQLRAGAVIYVPHPRESASTTEAVMKLGGIELRNLDLPVELALLRSDGVPAAIASFYCTALVNISVIFGDSVSAHAYRLANRALIRHHDLVAAIYAAMRSLNIPTLRFLEPQSVDHRELAESASLTGQV